MRDVLARLSFFRAIGYKSLICSTLWLPPGTKPRSNSADYIRKLPIIKSIICYTMLMFTILVLTRESQGTS